MSYYSRLYVVTKATKDDIERLNDIATTLGVIGIENRTWAYIHAMINTGPSNICTLFSQPSNCYFFRDDGNTLCLTDNYGHPLKEMSLLNLYNLLQDKLTDTVSPKIETVILVQRILAAFLEQENADSYYVIHYGY